MKSLTTGVFGALIVIGIGLLSYGVSAVADAHGWLVALSIPAAAIVALAIVALVAWDNVR